MSQAPILRPYNIMQPNQNRYQISMKNEIIRHLSNVYRKENKIPYYAPMSDNERIKFEKIIIRAGINEKDSMVLALEKFLKTMNTPERGYTSEDVEKLKRKLLGKEVE